MATTIVNPSGMTPGMNQIDSAFSNIYSMFGNQNTNLGGGPSNNFGIQPLTNPDNSLTGEWYNTANLAGNVAGSELATGGGLVGAGTGVTSGGLDMSGAGFGTTAGALSTLQPSIDFYQKLLAGDPAAMTAALAPAANVGAVVNANALTRNNQGNPAGGYKALQSTLLPSQLAGQVTNAALNLQPQAAQALQQASAEQAGIGAQEAAIGQGVSGTGLGLSGVGTTLTGQGSQTLQNLIADTLQKMGLNYSNSGINQFLKLMQGLGALGSGVGNAATGYGNATGDNSNTDATPPIASPDPYAPGTSNVPIAAPDTGA